MRSLRFRIISVLMIAVLTVGIITAYTYYVQSIANLKRNKQDATFNNLSQISKNISQYLFDIQNITKPIYINGNVQRLLKNGAKDISASISTRQYVAELTDTSSFLYDIVILDVNWKSLAGVHGMLDSDALFDKVRHLYSESKNPYEWLGPLQQVIDGDTRNHYVRVNAVCDILDYNRIIGYYCVFLDVNAIDNSFKYLMGEDSGIAIADKTGNIMFHSDGKAIGEAADTMLAPYEVEFSPEQQTIWKNDVLISLLPTDDDMTVFSIERLNHFKLERRILYRNIGLVLLMGIVISITCGTLLISIILRPLGVLRRSIVQMGEKGTVSPIPVKKQDEIGQLTSAFNNMTQQIHALMSDVSRLEHEKLASEIYALQAQINPHFVFNTLVTIRILAEQSGVKELSELINNFSRILRESMKIGRQYVTLKEEIAFIHSFCDIQQLRYSHKINLHIDVEPSLLDVVVLKFLLQIPVENSIKHGFVDDEDEGNIWVSCHRKDMSLYVVVEDDGLGFSDEKLREIRELFTSAEFKGFKDSIGLLNLLKRLQLYYGENCDVNLSNTKRGACVSLRVPVLFKEDVNEDSFS